MNFSLFFVTIWQKDELQLLVWLFTWSEHSSPRDRWADPWRSSDCSPATGLTNKYKLFFGHNVKKFKTYHVHQPRSWDPRWASPTPSSLGWALCLQFHPRIPPRRPADSTVFLRYLWRNFSFTISLPYLLAGSFLEQQEAQPRGDPPVSRTEPCLEEDNVCTLGL